MSYKLQELLISPTGILAGDHRPPPGDRRTLTRFAEPPPPAPAAPASPSASGPGGRGRLGACLRDSVERAAAEVVAAAAAAAAAAALIWRLVEQAGIWFITCSSAQSGQRFICSSHS